MVNKSTKSPDRTKKLDTKKKKKNYLLCKSSSAGNLSVPLCHVRFMLHYKAFMQVVHCIYFSTEN